MLKKLGFLFILAFILRVALIPIARHGDINNNTSWGQLLLSRGPVNFYEGKVWTFSQPNQPPLYLVTFASTAFIQNTSFNFIQWANIHFSVFPSKLIWWFDNWGELYIAKLPGIFADLGIAYLIYKFFETKKKTAIILCTLWLFNPVSWYNSAVWGGTDSIVNFLGLMSLFFLFRKNIKSSALFFTASVLFKGSLLLFIPLWILLAIKQNFKIMELTKALLFSLALGFILVFPFHPNIDFPIWFFNLYTKVFIPGEIGSLTANAFNLWWLVDPGKTLDSTVFFGLTARIWGILLTVVVYLFIFFKVNKKTNLQNIFLSLALVSLTSFLFMTRIHERYLYPFFPLCTIALAYFNWLWIPYVVLSLTYLLNLYHLFWAPGIPLVESLYVNQFMIVVSIVNLLVFAYISWKSRIISHV